MVNLHASCVLLDRAARAFDAPAEAGILILGESGSGKSDLALRLIERGALLVSDDRTELFAQNDRLMARAPQSIEGHMEIRNLGIIGLPHATQAFISLVVQVSDLPSPRLPGPERYNPPVELGIAAHAHPPLIRLCAFQASAPAKVVAAVAAHAKALFRNQRKSD